MTNADSCTKRPKVFGQSIDDSYAHAHFHIEIQVHYRHPAVRFAECTLRRTYSGALDSAFM